MLVAAFKENQQSVWWPALLCMPPSLSVNLVTSWLIEWFAWQLFLSFLIVPLLVSGIKVVIIGVLLSSHHRQLNFKNLWLSCSDPDRAYQQLLDEINLLEREPQWVPAAWVRKEQTHSFYWAHPSRPPPSQRRKTYWAPLTPPSLPTTTCLYPSSIWTPPNPTSPVQVVQLALKCQQSEWIC